MTDPAGALAFLVRRTVRNRFARQLARARSPRYAIALLIGIAYLVLVFYPSAAGGPAERNPNAAATITTLGAVAVAITVLLWWVKGGVSGALAFTQPEVMFLFPAPIGRRALLLYRIARSQIPLVLSAIVWTVLSRRWGVSIPLPLRLLTAWGFFSLLSLHRLSAALVQTGPLSGGRRALRQALFALAVAGLAAILIPMVPVFLRFGELGAGGGFSAIGEVLAESPASVALAPFRLMMAPLFAADAAAWAPAFGWVAGAIAFHVLWILVMRSVPFEEAAATASADLARRIASFRERRAGGAAAAAPRKAGWFRLPLAPVGWAPGALVWKNTLALVRTGALRVGVVIVVLCLVLSRVMDSAGRTPGYDMAMPFVMMAVMAFLMGPRVVRNDLRQDLLSLGLIKTYPLRGRQVVVAEMLSPTLVLTAFQLAVLSIGWFTLAPETRASPGGATVRAVAAVAPFLVLALNGASVGIQNAFALLFPAWVRLGPDSGGIEAIGQNVLMMIGSLLALVVALIPPLVAFVFVRAMTLATLGAGALAAGGAAGTLVLGLEIVGLVVLLGNAFDRVELTALA